MIQIMLLINALSLFLTVTARGLFFLVIILLSSKLYEFIHSTYWALRYGSAYTDDLLLAIAKWNETKFNPDELQTIMAKHKRTWSPARWPITGLLFRLPSPFKELSINYIFRIPTLMIFLTGIVILSADRLVLVVGVSLLWFGLWVVALHSIVYRLTQGYWDNYFSRTISIKMLPYPDPQPSELNPTRRKTMREFAKVFAWLLILVIIGYTGIYTGLSTLLGMKNAFIGINEGWTVPLDLFYFSVVTLGTVGFGDISPNPNALVVRLAVASQILIGFSLIVFLLTSFTLTVEPEEIRTLKK